MAPSAEDIERKIGRNLRRWDVLIGDKLGPGSYQFESSELSSSQIPSEAESLNQLKIELMRLTQLSPQGPVTTVAEAKDFKIEKGENCWAGVVKREDRKDLNFIQKLKIRLEK